MTKYNADFSFFENVKFIYEFRDYQKRVLDTLQEKLKDNKLHIVAAPGSGKTVLGIEILRRLDVPALVLTPSIGIREQWMDRFFNLFLVPEKQEVWKTKVSMDLEKINILNFCTYQAFYSKYQEDSLHNLLQELKKHEIHAIVLDEAHHLKREWWKALEELIREVPDITIISLTATPPYDASEQEWARYMALCGEIDIEIYTPEMVQKKNLCPYQDYLYFCCPNEQEVNQARLAMNQQMAYLQEMLKSEELYKALRKSIYLTDMEEAAILFIKTPMLLQTIISYVHYYGIESAYYYEEDARKADAVIRQWDQVLLQEAKKSNVNIIDEKKFLVLAKCILENEEQCFSEEFVEYFVQWLKGKHLYKNGKFIFGDAKEQMEKILRESARKLDAICEIAITEGQSRGNDLSLLVLVDHIGKEHLNLVETIEPLTKVDCVSVFERLRREEHLHHLQKYMMPRESGQGIDNSGSADNRLALGVLCGSFCILPGEFCKKIETGKTLGNTGYHMIPMTDANRKELVSKVTKLVMEGEIKTLIGTVSLLGEGWDAPRINSVILGSTVSSYVQSNQMRGRGFRMHPEKPDKVANIWHLCSLMPMEDSGDYGESEEYEKMVHRFDTLMGLSLDGSQVESGIERMGITSQFGIQSSEWVQSYNQRMKNLASDTETVRKQWQIASQNKDLSKVREVAKLQVRQHFRRIQGASYWSYREMSEIAKGLMRTLQEKGMISTKGTLNEKKDGQQIMLYLEDCSARERALFFNSLKTMLAKQIPGKYILVKSYLFRKKRCMAVPDCLANKKDALHLQKNIHGMQMHLVAAKSQEGRKLILSIGDVSLSRFFRKLQC